MYGKSEVLINQILLDRVIDIKQNKFMDADSYEEWKEELIEKIKLTRLGKMAESLNEDELAVLVLIAIDNDPELVFQIMLGEYLLNKERKKSKNDKQRII